MLKELNEIKAGHRARLYNSTYHHMLNGVLNDALSIVLDLRQILLDSHPDALYARINFYAHYKSRPTQSGSFPFQPFRLPNNIQYLTERTEFERTYIPKSEP